MLHAVDCLRPRRLGGAGLLAGRQSLLCWDAVAETDVETYRALWAGARMDRINDEAAIIAHRESKILDAKYRALERLYLGLSALVILGGILLAVYAALAVA